MTVGELIVRLNAFPKDADVVIDTSTDYESFGVVESLVPWGTAIWDVWFKVCPCQGLGWGIKCSSFDLTPFTRGAEYGIILEWTKQEKKMIVEIVAAVGGVAVSAVAVGYGVVRVAVASSTAFDTYANEDDSELEEDENEEDEG